MVALELLQALGIVILMHDDEIISNVRNICRATKFKETS
jgi:hypothetical protein